MSNIQPRRTNPFFRAIRKVFVSGFVVFTFVAYALHERFGSSAGGAAALPQVAATQLAVPVPAQQAAVPTAPPPSKATAAPVAQAAAPTAPPSPTATLAPTAAPVAQAAAPTTPPTASTAPTAAPAKGQYTDGEYSGPVTDAYYGNVQVKAVIQAGKLADVQFLEYPSDRRTSVRINNVAMPYLINEAIQAQSARVDVISGATLTSEAFAQSLQSALDSAKNNS